MFTKEPEVLPPVCKYLMLPYGLHSISEDDIAAVVEVLRSKQITQGPVVENFERSLCEYTGAGHAVTTNSATSALHLACRALDLGPGDRIWTSPITFVASANCGLYCGAEVDFVDIDLSTFNMDVSALATKLASAAEHDALPKVVVPVHMGGLSCDMEAIAELSRQFGFSIIEDASHAIGGRYAESPIGVGTFSDITVFSFHPVKIITTGEGGAALTNQPKLADKMRLLRSHGVTRDVELMESQPGGELVLRANRPWVQLSHDRHPGCSRLEPDVATR